MKKIIITVVLTSLVFITDNTFSQESNLTFTAGLSDNLAPDWFAKDYKNGTNFSLAGDVVTGNKHIAIGGECTFFHHEPSVDTDFIVKENASIKLWGLFMRFIVTDGFSITTGIGYYNFGTDYRIGNTDVHLRDPVTSKVGLNVGIRGSLYDFKSGDGDIFAEVRYHYIGSTRFLTGNLGINLSFK